MFVYTYISLIVVRIHTQTHTHARILCVYMQYVWKTVTYNNNNHNNNDNYNNKVIRRMLNVTYTRWQLGWRKTLWTAWLHFYTIRFRQYKTTIFLFAKSNSRGLNCKTLTQVVCFMNFCLNTATIRIIPTFKLMYRGI